MAVRTKHKLSNIHTPGTDCSSLDVPLVRLIRESEHFADMKTPPPEADVARAVQNHLSDVLEARILVSSPQNPARYSTGSRPDTAGGYEIRRKDWNSVRSITPPLRKRDWDAKTVYLVRIKLAPTSSPFPPINPSMNEMLKRDFGILGKATTTRQIHSCGLPFRVVVAQQPEGLLLRRDSGR